MTDYDTPPLRPVHATRIPWESWRPAGIELLPPGWVNVRLRERDALGREVYITEPCPGIVHTESAVTETVLQHADPGGSVWDENGELYDEHPVVVDTIAADPPHRTRYYVAPDWEPAYLGGGYLGSCPLDMVNELLAERGYADAIPRPSAR